MTALKNYDSFLGLVRKYLTTTLFCVLGLFFFVSGDSITAASLQRDDRIDLVVADISTSNNQNPDDKCCDIDDGDNVDDDCQANQRDLSVDLPKKSLNLYSTAKFLPDVICDIPGSSLDVSLIPNRAPPSPNQSA